MPQVSIGRRVNTPWLHSMTRRMPLCLSLPPLHMFPADRYSIFQYSVNKVKNRLHFGVYFVHVVNKCGRDDLCLFVLSVKQQSHKTPTGDSVHNATSTTAVVHAPMSTSRPVNGYKRNVSRQRSGRYLKSRNAHAAARR